jgi:hypothetical protein
VTSRRRLVAALLALTGCGGSSSPTDTPVAASIQLSTSSVSFSSLLATLDVTATVLSESGTPMSGVTVTWSSADAQVASVSPAGRITAVGNGVTAVTATAAGIQAEAAVTVEQIPFTLLLEPDPVELVAPLDTETLTAIVRDAGGSEVVPPASVTWTSEDESVATVSSAGVVMGVATGQTTVTAEVATGAAPLVESVTVSVGGDVLIVTTSLPHGLAGTAYDEMLVAVGGDGSYVWSLLSGSLPDGLSLGADGAITGTPTTPGSSSFTVEVSSDGETDTQALGIEILASVFIDTSYLIGGNVGAPYGDQIAPATGGTGSYTYAVTAGDLPDGLGIDETDGTISGTPTTPGVFFFEITASSGGQASAATYAITVSTVPANAFNLWISFDGGALPPENVVTALNGALARWEEVVTGDVNDITYPPTGLEPGDCSLVDISMLNGAFIEDVVVLMGIEPFDGPGKTLARGGPCGYSRGMLPVVISGQMSLDEADVASAPADYLEKIIWHEIGHAMGIGTLWQGSLTGAGTPDPRYTGTHGQSEWEDLAGSVAGGVPVQPNLEAHWDEGWFDSEIMTPTAEGPFGNMPISRVTIGALVDLGWTADLDAADAYSLPSCADTCSLQAPGEVVPFDIVVVDPLLPLPK